MYQAMGLTPVDDTSARLSFREQDKWLTVFPDVIMYDQVVLGAEQSGPMVTFISVAPVELPGAPTHAHASDSLRVCIRGQQLQGRKAYGAGEFRFQEGWVPYADEGFGADGMWGIIALADRRGCRARPVDPEVAESESEMRFRAAQKERNLQMGIEIDDMLSDDHTAGASATVTTLGPLGNSGKLDGSFADTDSWRAVGTSTRIVAALLGEPVAGPVFVFAATEPGAVAAPRCRFDTELLRIVVGGSCTIGGESYEAGDARVHAGGSWCDEVVAGPDGLHELVVLADRRHADVVDVDTTAAGASWTGEIGGIVRDLAAELAARPPSKRVNRLAPAPS